MRKVVSYVQGLGNLFLSELHRYRSGRGGLIFSFLKIYERRVDKKR